MRLVVVLGVLAALAATHASAAPPEHVRPGDGVGVPPTCTLGFFYRDTAGTTYASTAAHCVKDGQVIDTHRGKIGTVVHRETGDADVALIRLSSTFTQWQPGVRNLWGPHGIATHEETTLGDVLRTSGQGLVVRETTATQARHGVLVGDSPSEFWWSTVATPGDSGAPVLLHLNGKALGTVSRIGADRASTDEGPTVRFILEKLRASGYDVGLVLADGTVAR